MLRNIFVTILYFSLLLFSHQIVFSGTTPPTTTHILTPPSPNGKNWWYVTPVQIKLTAEDMESGVKDIYYKVDNGIWNKVEFANTLNQAPNPSFEVIGSTTTGLDQWEATETNGATYSQDITTSLPGFETSSAKIISTTDDSWYAINHKTNFVVTEYLNNMTAGVWLKNSSTLGRAGFRIYAINSMGESIEIAQSTTVGNTVDWVHISLDFTVSEVDSIGVYMEVGIMGEGTLWVDAANINSSPIDTSTSFVVGSDSPNHSIRYYSTDYAGNIETVHTITFKVDQTPPGVWHDSGAFRGILGPSDHHLYVYTTVEDATSGISTFTDKYQYFIRSSGGFGRYSDLMSCSSTWQPNRWAILITPPPFPGVKSAYILTPKTDFCNSNWKICKVVRFFAEDMAGNTSTKDLCINGPWLKFRGKAAIRSNSTISMLAEGEIDNTDGLIEAAGNTIDFFSSSRDWRVTESPIPKTYDYDELYDATLEKASLSNGNLTTNSGVYEINGNIELSNSNIPNNYDSEVFDQVVFVDGNLRISTDIGMRDNSSALFIVKGNVEIGRNVTSVEVAIIADGNFYTAYDIEEGQASDTLELKGFYSANKFYFQRTLQGTGNENYPSEDFLFNPRYLVKLKEYFNESTTIKWLGTD